jgi:hypothetical protein
MIRRKPPLYGLVTCTNLDKACSFCYETEALDTSIYCETCKRDLHTFRILRGNRGRQNSYRPETQAFARKVMETALRNETNNLHVPKGILY